VKSQEFIVYSAKKFPGLAESTQLSRVVAEQGCRVRIRRDVRMRRRDGKGTGDYDNAEDEYARRRRTATPDTRPDYNRARSMSGSVERTPYSADSQRRPSIADYQSQYPPQNPPPGGHLQFLGGNSTPQYPAQAPSSFAQPPSVPASPLYPPSQGAAPYPSQSSYPPPPPPPPSYQRERTPSNPPPPPPPSYQGERTPSNPPPPRRDSLQQDYRPPSGSTSGPVTLPPLSHLSSYPPTPSQTHMPPPKPQMPPRLQIDGNMASASRLPLPSPTSLLRPSGSSGPVLNPHYLPPPAQYAGTKRAHDQTFRHDDGQVRFQDGARDKGLSEDAHPSSTMVYRRADGTHKSVPDSWFGQP
jgi:hypothetical protein